MAVQQFCLRWNNHQPNFVSVFTSLLNNESLVDVTLAAEGRHLQAHRVVLSACSTYFQTLFTVNPCQHPIVILKDVKYNDLKTMVDFMYYGEVNVSQEQLPAILKASFTVYCVDSYAQAAYILPTPCFLEPLSPTAEMLKIKGLAEMPEYSSGGSLHMSKSLSVSSDKGELPTTAADNWSSTEMTRRSASPMSPAMRRKRLRKSSTGSGSGSTAERTSEELPSEITLIPSPAMVKPEPLPSMLDGNGRGSDSSHPGSLRNSTQEPSTDSEPREGSQDSVEDDHITMMGHSQDSNVGSMDTSLSDTGPGPSTSMGSQHQQNLASQGIQWTLLEHHGYPRFALSSCQANLSVQASSAFDPSHPLPSRSQYPAHNQIDPIPSCIVAGQYSSTSPCPSSCSSPCTSPLKSAINPAGQQVRRKRSTNPQADENFVRALDAVRFGGIGFCKAARMFGVNNRTLWLEYKKRGYPVTRPSLKSRVKQEISSSTGGANNTNQQMAPSQSNMAPPSQPMGPPPTVVNMSGFLDSRPNEFVHPQSPIPPRHRFQEIMTGNINASQMNPHGVIFNQIPTSKVKIINTGGRKLIIGSREVVDSMLRVIHAVCLDMISINKAALCFQVSCATLWRYMGMLEKERERERYRGYRVYHQGELAPLFRQTESRSVLMALTRRKTQTFKLRKGTMQNFMQAVEDVRAGKYTSSSSLSSKAIKRGRPLIRQPRVKKELDPSQPSPDSEPSSPQLLTVPPMRVERQHSEPTPNLLSVPQPAFLVKQLSHPLPSQSPCWPVHRQLSQPGPSPPTLNVQLVTTSEQPLSRVGSPSMMEQVPVLRIVPDQDHSKTSQLRVRTDEFRRASSSPQASSPREGFEPQRSVHCPVLRPGPALGCNFCWNTIDGHGRILRRKTKYHCPECQTNLCIVPCFQEYHERQTTSTGVRDSSGSLSPNIFKVLPKTSSI
uniref:Uncharacterized protein n=1 Tax=Timema tahoe TaxID=61484 RepID=A0A7R9FI13_9NEOP|nr:unnamed protein product [Timema tahoe]